MRNRQSARMITTVTKAYDSLLENIRREGVRCARTLGLRPGPGLRDRVVLELEWWQQQGMSEDDFECVCQDIWDGCTEVANGGPDWHRVASLEGIQVLLETESHVDGFGGDWFKDFDRYLSTARRFARTASAGPSVEILQAFAVIRKVQNEIAEIERQAEAKIKKANDELEAVRRRYCMGSLVSSLPG